MSNAVVRDFSLFGDEVFSSTDLNRRSAEVLNRASKNPVTISRNNEWFALLRRDQAATLVKGLAQTVMVVQLAQGSIAIQQRQPQMVPPAVSWMKAFDDEERLTMLSEVFTACLQASEEDDWDSVSETIHQWRESAAVAESGILRDARAAEPDEQPLPDPNTVMEDEVTAETDAEIGA